VALSEFIVADDLNREQVRDWVQAHRELQQGLPALVRREIDKVFGEPPVANER
jgi:hypothetical protein